MAPTLVINLARMGDLLQCTPLLAGLKARGDPVTLMVPDAFAAVAKALPDADEIVVIPLKELVEPLLDDRRSWVPVYRRLKEIAGDLRRRRFGLVVNITHSHYSGALAGLLVRRDNGGAPPELVGLGLDERGLRIVRGDWANYYFNAAVNRGLNRFNLVDIHCRLGGVAPGGPLRLTVTPEDRRRAAELAHDLNLSGRLVALVPGASTPEKQWHIGGLIEVARMVTAQRPVKVVVFGTLRERVLGRRLAEAVPGAVNLCGKTGLGELAALLARCDLCLTNDTGSMHVAAAVGTPVLDLSLGSALSHETAPYGHGHVVVEPRLACFPCAVKWRCPHRSCHSEIPPAAVAKLAAMMLDEAVPDRLPDQPEYAGVNIYRTAFDRRRWFQLEPLVVRAGTAEDLMNAAYRLMWRSALDDGDPDPPDAPAAAGVYAETLRERYLWDDPPELPPPHVFARLTMLARQGAEVARKLAGMGDGVGRVSEAAALGAALREVDAAIMQLCHQRPELLPLATQFFFSKDNFTGSRLDDLARQAADLYARLAGWSAALPRWLAALSRALCLSPRQAVAV